jgi:hypothetical protein
MTLPEWIQKNQSKIDAKIGKGGRLDDNERRLWVLNDPDLYYAAKKDGVQFEASPIGAAEEDKAAGVLGAKWNQMKREGWSAKSWPSGQNVSESQALGPLTGSKVQQLRDVGIDLVKMESSAVSMAQDAKPGDRFQFRDSSGVIVTVTSVSPGVVTVKWPSGRSETYPSMSDEWVKLESSAMESSAISYATSVKCQVCNRTVSMTNGAPDSHRAVSGECPGSSREITR